MNFYIDFEATQPEQEIISIGVYSDDEKSFYSLVKPQFSSVSKYITDMTGITNEMLDKEYDLNVVLGDLYTWCYNQESAIVNWHFYSYGDSDVDFLKHSLPNITGENALIIASLMIATMKDYSKNVAKYFRGTTSLIKAFNYLEELEKQQKHNALDDAKMLADVFMKTYDKKPLESYPFRAGNTEISSCYIFPTGKFYCKSNGKNAKEHEFIDIHDAMTWLINNHIGKDARDKIHRDKMAKKIMKAIRKNETYMNYKWRRVKKGEDTNV